VLQNTGREVNKWKPFGRLLRINRASYNLLPMELFVLYSKDSIVQWKDHTIMKNDKMLTNPSLVFKGFFLDESNSYHTYDEFHQTSDRVDPVFAHPVLKHSSPRDR